MQMALMTKPCGDHSIANPIHILAAAAGMLSSNQKYLLGHHELQSALAQALQCPCPQALLCSDLRPEAAVFLRSSTLLTTLVAAPFAALSAALTPAPTTAPAAFSALRHRHWVLLSIAQVSTHDTLCCMWTDCSRSANLTT